MIWSGYLPDRGLAAVLGSHGAISAEAVAHGGCWCLKRRLRLQGEQVPHGEVARTAPASWARTSNLSAVDLIDSCQRSNISARRSLLPSVPARARARLAATCTTKLSSQAKSASPAEGSPSRAAPCSHSAVTSSAYTAASRSARVGKFRYRVALPTPARRVPPRPVRPRDHGHRRALSPREQQLGVPRGICPPARPGVAGLTACAIRPLQCCKVGISHYR